MNETKTKLCQVPTATFDFLGYTFGRCYSPKTGRAFIGTRPAQKKIRKLCESISEATSPRQRLLDAEEVVAGLNRKLRGWANYFKIGPVSKAYTAVDRHVTFRLRRWLCKKHKTPGAGFTRYSDTYLYQELGLVRLLGLKRYFPTRTHE